MCILILDIMYAKYCILFHGNTLYVKATANKDINVVNNNNNDNNNKLIIINFIQVSDT